MNNTLTVDSLLKLVLDYKIFPRKDSVVYHFKDVFEKVKLKNKKVLDIGGGTGILSFYSGIMGAGRTVCLEPESDGSSGGMISQFDQLKKELDDSLPVEQVPLTLQAYLQRSEEDFDVVILNNSINHLNEPACINLRKDNAAYQEYLAIFSALYKKMSKDGQLIITDCSNKNFYNDIGMTSPFINSIEWHKHQHPNTWIALLREVGFSNPVISWSSPNRLGLMGRVLLKNAVCAYFTSSHFRLSMTK